MPRAPRYSGLALILGYSDIGIAAEGIGPPARSSNAVFSGQRLRARGRTDVSLLNADAVLRAESTAFTATATSYCRGSQDSLGGQSDLGVSPDLGRNRGLDTPVATG